MRSGWTAERQCASIMMAIACSIGWPSPSWTARLTACTAVGELLAIFSAMRMRRRHELAGGVDLVDQAELVGLAGGDRVAGHQHLQCPAAREQAGQQRGGAAAGGQAEHRLGLPEGGVVGGDDEVDALGQLGPAAVGDPVDGGEDGFAQLAHGVEGAVEVLALPQPVLLGHVLALAQVAADREGPVAGAGEDDDPDRGAHRDGLHGLGQAGSDLGGDGVVGVRPVERHHGDRGRRRGSRAGPGFGFGLVGAGGPKSSASQRLSGVCWRHVVLLSVVVGQVSRSASQRIARRPGAKQYSPPRVMTKGGRSVSRRRMGRCGMVNVPDPSFGPTRGSFSAGAPMKMPSLSHWVLTNSNCRSQVRPGEHEDDAAVRAVVLEHALGQHRAVAGAAADHPVQADVDAAVVVEGVPGVGSAGVGARRALQAARVVAVPEVVVALRVGAELRGRRRSG